MSVYDGGGESISLRLSTRDCSRSISNALVSSMPWRSMSIPLARSVRARRPKAPWRSWYSAKRLSTMSMALCQSSTSASLMCAKTPRLDASLMNSGRGRGAGRSPGRPLPGRSCRSAQGRALSCRPGPRARRRGAPWRSPGLHPRRRSRARSPRGRGLRRSGDQRQSVLTLIGDQDSQMLGFAGANDAMRARTPGWIG